MIEIMVTQMEEIITVIVTSQENLVRTALS
jgi:hypothetical protein